MRPEHLNAEGEGQSQIKGEVFAVERLGGETYLYVRTEGERELTVHAAGDKTVSAGESIAIGFDFKDCHLFGNQGNAFQRLAA